MHDSSGVYKQDVKMVLAGCSVHLGRTELLEESFYL